MKGPFALSLNGALRKIFTPRGSRLTWTTQREQAAQIMGGMEDFFIAEPYGLGSDNGSDMGLGQGYGWPE